MTWELEPVPIQLQTLEGALCQLLVNGKPATKRFFRQLQEDDITNDDDDDETLRGTPLGFIDLNTQIKRFSPPQHVLIWSDGGTLRRGGVPEHLEGKLPQIIMG